MKYNKGFAPVVVLLIVLGVLAVGGVAYFAGKSSTPKNEVADNSNYYPPVQQNQNPPTINNNPPQQQTPPPANNPPPQQAGCNSNSPSTIKVLSPNGGEVYQAGQQITVKWKSCNVTPNSIGIILIKHDSSVPYTQSEGQGDYAGFSLGNYSTADDGIEQITLPASSNPNLISGLHYFISVIGLGDATNIGSGYTPGDYSNGLFTINTPIVSNPCNNNSTPSITVLSPNGGETYTVGQQMIVKWNTCNVSSSSNDIVIALHQNGAWQNVVYLTNATVNDGIETFTVPTAALGSYKIRVGHASGAVQQDFSDNLFTVN